MATDTDTFVTDVAFGQEVIVTTVTSSGVAVEGWIQEIRSVLADLVVGLDVEWRPSYSPSQNPVALLQLCVDRRCLIFQLLHADFVPQALSDFLADPTLRFVGVGVREDVERLIDDHDLKVANTVDLRGIAAEGMQKPELRQAGLQALARAVMGADAATLQKPQRVRMGPWDAYCLSLVQIKYACTDAFVSFEVGRKLLTGDLPVTPEKMEQEKLEKLARKGPSTGEQAPSIPSSAASDVKAGGAGPTASTSTGMSTDKNRNYAVLAGTVAGLGALGWYLLSKEPKKTEEVVD